jgi:hypothetical protein
MIVTDTFRIQNRNNTQEGKGKQNEAKKNPKVIAKTGRKKRHYHRNIEVSFQEEPKKGNKRRKEEWKKT